MTLVVDILLSRVRLEVSDVWWSALVFPSDAELDWLARAGVPDEAVFASWPVQSARVVFEGRGGFRFERPGGEEAARRALVFRVGCVCGREDLVAWQPRTGAVGAWGGLAAMLGEEVWGSGALAAGDDGLAVHASPLEWLRAGRAGVVPVRWRAAAALLAGERALVCGDLGLAERLRRAMAPRLPQFLVRSDALEEAA